MQDIGCTKYAPAAVVREKVRPLSVLTEAQLVGGNRAAANGSTTEVPTPPFCAVTNEILPTLFASLKSTPFSAVIL